jgi:hypothetical protein
LVTHEEDPDQNRFPLRTPLLEVGL